MHPLRRRVRWGIRVGLSLGVVGVGALGFRYGMGVARTYGAGSSLTWNPVAARHVVEQALARDSFRFSIGLSRRLGVGMEHVSVSPMGPLAPEDGLIFATGTDVGYLRPLDEDTGEMRWSHHMAAAGSAPPVTCAVEGRQYVAAVATGGQFHNFVDRASRLYLFALPDG